MKHAVIPKMLWMILLPLTLPAGSPIPGYQRGIAPDGAVVYTQKEGNFTFRSRRIVDMDNIYAGGTIDNYDDPYIATILDRQTPCRTIRGGERTIRIVFDRAAHCKQFVRNPGLGLFRKAHLRVQLYVLDRSRITLPLHLSVYPFFVMGDRFVQGVITPKLLTSLITESDYTRNRPTITLNKLKQKLHQKYRIDDRNARITYNPAKALYEVYDKRTGRFSAYVSRDGRYGVWVK